MPGGSQSSELWRKQKSLAPTGNVQFVSCTSNSLVTISTVLSWFKLAQVCKFNFKLDTEEFLKQDMNLLHKDYKTQAV